jgi:hypothetical protein
MALPSGLRDKARIRYPTGRNGAAGWQREALHEVGCLVMLFLFLALLNKERSYIYRTPLSVPVQGPASDIYHSTIVSASDSTTIIVRRVLFPQ